MIRYTNFIDLIRYIFRMKGCFMKRILVFSLLGNLFFTSLSIATLSMSEWSLYLGEICGVLKKEPYPEAINWVDTYLSDLKLEPKDKEEIIGDVLERIFHEIQITMHDDQRRIWINEAIFINLMLGPDARDKIMDNFNEKIVPYCFAQPNFTPDWILASVTEKFREIMRSEESRRIKNLLIKYAQEFFKSWDEEYGERLRESQSLRAKARPVVRFEGDQDVIEDQPNAKRPRM